MKKTIDEMMDDFCWTWKEVDKRTDKPILLPRKRIVVAFRGRSTENVLSDAGVHADIVICREGDTLRQSGDLTVEEAIALLKKEQKEYAKKAEEVERAAPYFWAADLDNLTVVLIGNGGTTEQQIPFTHFLFRGEEGWQGSYLVVQIERDGNAIELAKREHKAEAFASSLSREEAKSLYERTSW